MVEQANIEESTPGTMIPVHRPVRVRAREFKVYQRKDIDSIPQLSILSPEELLGMKAVSAVLPFRTNNYVVEKLIRWDRVPDDPMYQLTFPQREMLSDEDFNTMLELVRRDADPAELQVAARKIQQGLNPHPAGQMELNVPSVDGEPVPGIQHKYRETVLFFPSQGQTCHAYCTYCFRWPQFVGIDELKFASRESQNLTGYLREHPEVSSVLFTGGDPLIMKTSVLRRYIEPLLEPGLEHVTSIRLGTKAPAYWPYRFVTDKDSDDLMRLFEQVRKAGKHLALMAHFSHPRELETPIAQAAIRRMHANGAVVRCQAPLIRHVNDSSTTWADMWRLQVQLGAVPHYMFVERDTGPKNYFDVPLARALEIFNTAYRRVSGLARTVRGPSMSATPGKVKVLGINEIHGEKVFVLTFEQARDPAWVGRVFFAKFSPTASWLDQLQPALGEKDFFFEPEMREIKATGRARAWGDRVPTRREPALFGHVEWD
jgi:KamA family protein